MKCPYCGNMDTKVLDSRAMDEGAAIRRRRYCEECRERFTTYERVDTIPLTVIKRDGSRELFDRNKLQNGIRKSCNKRPVSVRQIEEIVDNVEQMALNTLRKEISSEEIGEMVMELLKTLDEVAYVRFASVYRKFTDVDSFVNALNALLQEKRQEGREKE